MAVNFEWRVEFFNIAGVVEVFKTRWQVFFEEQVVPIRNHAALQLRGTNKKAACNSVAARETNHLAGRAGTNARTNASHYPCTQGDLESGLVAPIFNGFFSRFSVFLAFICVSPIRRTPTV
jgi:hypothetical protein